ncbi:MAG TPA: COG1361 S-layer family protein [archaeon]|nr:COG1361 S-layer family protein [archaeon]
MKYPILVFLVVFFAFATLVNSQIAAPHIEIELVNQNPYPAEPGKNVNVEVDIKNTGLGDATDIVVELVSKAPFTLLPGEEAIKGFSRITSKGSAKATYELSVGDSALANNYNLEFRVYTGSNRNTYTIYEVKIKLQGATKLLLEDVSLLPEDLGPGSKAVLGVMIRNIGTGTARQLQLEFNATDKLIPILNRGQAYLGDLGPESVKEALLEISVDSTAERRTYSAILTATYLDQGGDQISKQFTIGIPVVGSVSLDIVNIELQPDKKRVVIEVANKGTVPADSVEALLIVDNKTVGTEYTNQIKPTKKATFTFPLFEGQAQLQLAYRMNGLGDRQVTKDIVFPGDNRGATGLATGGSGFSAIASIVVLIALVAYVFLRREKIARKLGRHREE